MSTLSQHLKAHTYTHVSVQLEHIIGHRNDVYCQLPNTQLFSTRTTNSPSPTISVNFSSCLHGHIENPEKKTFWESTFPTSPSGFVKTSKVPTPASAMVSLNF